MCLQDNCDYSSGLFGLWGMAIDPLGSGWAWDDRNKAVGSIFGCGAGGVRSVVGDRVSGVRAIVVSITEPIADFTEAMGDAGKTPKDNAIQKGVKTAMKVLKGTIADLPATFLRYKTIAPLPKHLKTVGNTSRNGNLIRL
jgi:hypothetical protein